MKNIKILQSNKVCKNFYVVLSFLLNSESKITYWNIKIRADEHATNGEKGVFSQSIIFPTPYPFDVDQNIPLAI